MSTPSDSARPSPADRRRHPRVAARGRVSASLDQASAVTIVDLSQGGFLLESAEPFLVGSIHQFRMETAKGEWTTVLTARSMHSRQQGDGYLTGFAFVEPLGDEAGHRLRALVEHVTSVVAY